tara:strand:+ start:269 stop:574 length:306 start_codon:yes stop_codon:yes gene_type:complete
MVRKIVLILISIIHSIEKSYSQDYFPENSGVKISNQPYNVFINAMIKVDKSATFFISNGDALDMRTNILNHAFIDGREVSLKSHQTKLWQRYLQKFSINKN